LAGTTCNNQTKTCEGDSGISNLDNKECGKGTKCVGDKDNIISGLGGLGGEKMPCCSWLGILPLAVVGAATKRFGI
jgi:hypothetical protein